MFADRIRATTLAQVHEDIEFIRLGHSLSNGALNALLARAFHLVQTEEHYNLGLSVICHVAEMSPADPFIRQLLHDCIVAARVFLYQKMLGGDNPEGSLGAFTSLYDEFALSHYTLETNTVLTKPQKDLFNLFQEKKRLVVSAPTSFGKSRVIDEIICANHYNNIAIILPTNALLHETFVRLKSNSFIQSMEYSFLTSPRQTPEGKRNIFIYTPEKLDVFLDRHPEVNFNLFVMDEIYKIDGEDERATVFTNCLYRLSKRPCDFYLIGPYFESFSREFLVRTQATFKKYSSEIVQKDFYDINAIEEGDSYQIEGTILKKFKGRDTNLKHVVQAVGGQSMVYVGRKASAESKARLISKIQRERSCPPELEGLVEYIADSISPEWSLVEYLMKGVAFHHAGLPKYIAGEIVEAFNNGHLDVIVCSPTLAEGVNTTAKNVILVDEKKGEAMLSSFDVKNIRGRAGRFGSHFIGRVISLAPLPSDDELPSIEFSFYGEEPLTAEQIILVDSQDLSMQNRELRRNIIAELRRSNVPLELIRSNKYIAVHKQLALIELLRNDPGIVRRLSFTRIPTGAQFEEILRLCHEHLFSEKDRQKCFIETLVIFAKKQLYFQPTIKELVDTYEAKSIDTKIRNVFTIVYHFYEYALPKYLNALENIFNYVSTSESMDMSFVITKLEFGSTLEHEIALKEAGLPMSTIKKIGNIFSDCSSIGEIRKKYSLTKGRYEDLHPYEQKLLDRYL